MAKALSRWFWGGFLLLLLTGLILVVFATIRGGQQWAQRELEQSSLLPPPVAEMIRVTLSGGESLYLPPSELPGIRRDADSWLTERRRQVDQALGELLDPALDKVFAQAEALVGNFADWYYSLGGEYLRLYHAAVGDLPEFLGERMQAEVFDPAGTAQALDGLVSDLDQRLASELGQSAQAYQAELLRLLRNRGTDSAPANLRVRDEWDAARGMHETLGPLFTLSGADLGRQGLATGAGVAVSAAVIKKLGANTVAKTTALIAGKQSTGMLAALAAKLGLKSAAKGGGALAGAGTGAATGAALCTGTLVGAPLAPGCALVGGVVAGATTWVLVDKAVLEADELLNREDLESDMRSSLREQREALREYLRAHYARVADQAFQQMGRVLVRKEGE